MTAQVHTTGHVLTDYPWISMRCAEVKEDHGGRYVNAECPLKCHHSASLRFWVGENGALVFTCWAGCEKLEVLRALGCGWKDCFPGGVMPDFPKQEIVKKYPYQDAVGTVQYQTVRLEPGLRGRDKDFKQRRPRPLSAGGGWEWNLEGVTKILYRLPEILAAKTSETIFVVGGEKDADTLREIGLVGTTNVCGERAEWLDSYSETLAGRHVCVIEDRDSTGARHCNEVCGSLMAWGAATLRRVKMPKPYKDSTAYLNGLRANGVRKAAELREQFEGVIETFHQWEPKGV